MAQPTAMMTLDIGSVRATLLALVNDANVEDAARVALEDAAKVLLKHARKVLSLTDHTLRDLRRMDHPTPSGTVGSRIHKATPWKVHTHTGRLLRALKDTAYDVGEAPPTWSASTRLRRPTLEHIVNGTRTMLPATPSGLARRSTLRSRSGVAQAISESWAEDAHQGRYPVRVSAGSGTVLSP